MRYKIRPVDMEQDKCRFCPLGIVRTRDYGNDHLHDFCDGCSWRLCLPALGRRHCW